MVGDVAPRDGGRLADRLAMGLLGAGNGIVFQLIPQRFQREIGVVTGIVGAAGGIGGFLLPSGLGLAKDSAGSFSPGLFAFAFAALFSSRNRLVRLAGLGRCAKSAIEPAIG